MILRLEILNHGLLVSVDPARKDKEEKLEVEVHWPLSNHGDFYHVEKLRITLDPINAHYDGGMAASWQTFAVILSHGSITCGPECKPGVS